MKPEHIIAWYMHPAIAVEKAAASPEKLWTKLRKDQKQYCEHVAKEVIHAYNAASTSKAAKARWAKVSKEERSRQMTKVSHARKLSTPN